MRNKPNKYFFAVLFILATVVLKAQPAANRFFDDRKAVEQWIRENKVPALGIAIIREGELRELRMYGEIRPGTPAPVDALFNVASLTKPVVAILALKLINDGHLLLDEPLFRYWVDPDIANDARHKLLTPRIVLTHQTGFKNWRYQDKDNKLSFDTTPGTRFGYSGEGFEYLRKAIENKFHQELEVLSDSMLLRPLKMYDTRHAWTSDIDENKFAHWFDANGKEHSRDYKLNRVNAADDLVTTIADYGKFAVHVLNGAGLDTPTYAEMIRPHVETRKGIYYGLGWELIPDLGPAKELVLLHTGSDAGVRTLVVLVPSSKQGLIVFTNSDNGTKLYERTVQEFLDTGRDLMKRAQ